MSSDWNGTMIIPLTFESRDSSRNPFNPAKGRPPAKKMSLSSPDLHRIGTAKGFEADHHNRRNELALGFSAICAFRYVRLNVNFRDLAYIELIEPDSNKSKPFRQRGPHRQIPCLYR
jgi:hypothetical protein